MSGSEQIQDNELSSTDGVRPSRNITDIAKICEAVESWQDGVSERTALEGRLHKALGDLELSKMALHQMVSRIEELEVRLSRPADGERLTVTETEALRHRLAQLESRLSQRSEEVEQVWRQASVFEERLAASEQRECELVARLEKEKEWVFRLAGQRREVELAHAALERLLSEEQRRSSGFERAIDRLKEKLRLAHRQMHIASSQAVHEAERKNSLIEQITAELAEAKENAILQKSMFSNAIRRAREVARLSENEIGALIQRVSHLESEVKSSAAVADATNDKLSMLHLKASSRSQEIAVVTGLLQSAEQSIQIAQEQKAWLVAVNRAMMRVPWWWGMMPLSWRNTRVENRLLKRNLFNSTEYLRIYPDVSQSGQSAIEHYINHGMDEGRIRPV